jgi:hypothetical protein
MRRGFLKRGANAWAEISELEAEIDETMVELDCNKPSSSPLSTAQLNTVAAHMRQAAKLLKQVHQREAGAA